MDPNQNNNSSGSDPNASPAGLPNTPQGNAPGDFSVPPPPPSPTLDPSGLVQPDLNNFSTPEPAPAPPGPDWASPPAPVWGSSPSSSPLGGTPDDTQNSSGPAPLPPVADNQSGMADAAQAAPSQPDWASAPAPAPASSPAPAWGSSPSSSPLGGTPDDTQAPPPMPPSPEPMPTFIPPSSAPPLSGDSGVGVPSWSGAGGVTNDISSPPQFPPTWPPEPSALGESGPGESGPTDLSHLMGNSAGGEAVSPVPAPAATVVSSQPADVNSGATPPPAQPGESQVVTNSPSGGFPKWAMLVGVVVLLIVVAASAYFILGVGSSGESEQTSLPAEQAPLTNPPRAIIPSPTVAPPASTPSASFGNLQGDSPQSSTPSGQSGSSALELLRQRQGQ